ncbi:MAG TPA: type VI secretion system needle protein Hcp [Porphyromonadaceae bacterium]|nr:type VI secretion system needle protein Hcp [Porphyromonadaceae bacterium]
MNTLPHAHLVVKFKLDEKIYEVDDFSIRFDQPVDYKKQPQHEVHGGSMSLTLMQTADDTLYTWAKTSTKRKDGQVVFETDLGITVLEINFENAYCTELISEVNASSGACISLKIDPEIISMNGFDHDNNWPQ